MVLNVRIGLDSEQVSLMRPICIKICISVLKQVVLILRVVLILGGLYSRTLLYLFYLYSLTWLYTVGWPCSSTYLDIFQKIILDSSKNGRWIITIRNLAGQGLRLTRVESGPVFIKTWQELYSHLHFTIKKIWVFCNLWSSQVIVAVPYEEDFLFYLEAYLWLEKTQL